ncbi:hypothetical protein SLE2022_381010 [Rubroshorea leprosula]
MLFQLAHHADRVFSILILPHLSLTRYSFIKAMNLKVAIAFFSYIPLVGHAFRCLPISSDDQETVSEGEKTDPAVSSNRVAQKHFQQLQHIRAA